MPKLKTKSSLKGRFSLTSSGKVKANQSGKRHGMVKRSKGFIRKARGTVVMSVADAGIVKKFMPYGIKGNTIKRKNKGKTLVGAETAAPESQQNN